MSINSENYIVVDYTKRELQVAIWRDSARKRLVIAFRGTEQVGYIYIYMFALGRLVPYLLVQKVYANFAGKMEGLANGFDASSCWVLFIYFIYLLRYNPYSWS